MFPDIIRRTLIFWLISTNTQSSADIPHKPWRNYILKLTVLAMFMAVLGYSTPAHAGFLSFIGGLFDFENSIEKAPITNSQNVALLEGVFSYDLDAGKGGGDIAIVGQSALLPNSGPMGTIANIEEQEANQGQISIYVVREGDSLSKIAKMFDVSVNTVIWGNDIKRGDLIRIGQTLVILPVSGVQYTIKKGDTLKKIAKKFKGDIDEIVQYNGLAESEVLAVGEEIIIPNGEGIAPKYSPSYSKRRVRGTGGPSYGGYYMRPINGGVNSRATASKPQGLHGYNAVDLAVSCGTPVLASASGTVIISDAYGWNAGYGKYIVVKHSNGTQTLYAHNSQNIVSSGQKVVQGQVIGYIGSTGKSTGCHVHFEVRGAKNPIF